MNNCSLLYIDNDLTIPSFNKSILLRFSRLQYGPDLFPYGLIDDVDVLRHAFYISRATIKRYNPSIDECPTLKSWLLGETEPPKLKVSALHLRHVTIKELRRMDWQGMCLRNRYMLKFLEGMAKVGMHESMFVGLLLWSDGLPDEGRMYSEVSGIWGWQYENVEDFARQIKTKFSLRLKALQNLVPLNLKPFFEMEVLVNRGIGEVDWRAEKEHRTKPNVASFTREQIYRASGEMFTRLKNLGSKPDNIKWKSYWNKRWQWAPTGAYHSQYPEDEEFRADDSLNRHKFYSLNAMPEYDLDHFLNRRAEIVAWPSTKYEWTKMRAIYGVDATNFILSGFVFGDCEKVLSNLFPIGPSATDKNVRSTVQEVLRNGVPYCFDFEDFNSQHSVSSMKAVLEAYFAVFGKRMSLEQQRVFPWLLYSLDNCYIKEEGGGKYKSEGTLLSGWRLTTFMNTVLNYVYTKIMTENANIVSTHNGDDVLAAIKNMSQVQKLVHGAEKYNVRFQMNKCYLASVSEFLRVDHHDTENGQYLSRAIATLVHGPTEMAVPNSLLALQTAIITRIAEARARGCKEELLQSIKEQQYDYLAKKWNTTIEELQTIEDTHISLGGLNINITDNSLAHRITQREYRSTELKPKQEKDMKRPLPGAWAYARQVCKVVIDKNYLHVIAKRAEEAVKSLSISRKFGVEITKVKPDNNIRIRASLYGLYRSLVPHTKLLLARAFGIPISAITENDLKVWDIVKHETDVLDALSILI
uniref:RNA-directed RNA polymerase n=1 Tax=Uromyces fabae virus TaxID=3069272 RepID=A0AA51U952_9VIRU|nr:putative RNA-dependent RNA polymerase [Uromyces fabae virus]